MTSRTGRKVSTRKSITRAVNNDKNIIYSSAIDYTDDTNNLEKDDNIPGFCQGNDLPEGARIGKSLIYKKLS